MALSIPHKGQRYPTVGDYNEAHGQVLFTVSEVGNEDYESLVLIHELVEYLLIKKHGIRVADIDAFDIEFEARRDRGEVTGEPGDAPDAPYRLEHRFAENIERQLALALGVDWYEYEQALERL